ncbi:MAG: hypothetical protein ACKO13_10500, partial [Cytophagales bacterium]
MVPYKLPTGYERLEEPDAGFVTPERSILLYANPSEYYDAGIGAKIRARGRSCVGKRVDFGDARLERAEQILY